MATETDVIHMCFCRIKFLFCSVSVHWLSERGVSGIRLLLFMLRIGNYSFVYSFNVRVTFKTNEGVCKETTEWPSTPQFSTCRAL